MMTKNIYFLSIMMVFCWSLLWAGGRKENESRNAEDPAGFTDSIDISKKPSGKYNYYLEAKDKAGNISLSGPENIYNDPETDLPRATIINPVLNMRVQGNLNIVGIAMDDDGIDFVDIVITRGWDGKGEELVRTRADGKEYWSYFLDTTNGDIWTDGIYTITVWATDINGLSGIASEYPNGASVPVKVHKKHQVYWNLDRKKPDIRVVSHEVGALVAGKIRLKGTVTDGNGINTFSYSIDGGKRYLPVKAGFDKKTGSYNWDVDINTKLFEDGPAIIWFQARDGQNTLGSAAHLLFANNTGPEIKIVYPPVDTAVNGIFSIAGYAKHPVGLNSITWKAGKASGEFPIVIGNHWWSTEIDLRGEKTSSVEIEIRAEDVSGNVTVSKQKYKVDQNADLPVISMYEPSTGDVLKSKDLVVRGLVKDDDGAASLFYSLDAGTAVEIPCSGLFQFIIPGLSEGIHNLDIWAKDITGVTGNKVQIKNLTVPAALPVPGITSFSTGSGKTLVVSPFYTGMTITPEPKMIMEFTAKAAVVASASVKFGDLPAIPVKTSAGKDGIFRGNVTVPVNLSGGFTKIELRAADRSGREGYFEEYIFVSDRYGYQFDWIRPNKTDDGRILLGDSEETLLGFGAERLEQVELRGTGAQNLYVEVDNFGRAVLMAQKEGSYGPLTLYMLDENNQTRESSPFRILADFSPPVVSMRNTPEGNWVQDSVQVSFNVSSRNRVASVEYSSNMGALWQPLLSNAEISALGAEVNTDITRTLNIGDAEDGSVNVLIRAVSEAGRTGTADFTVLKDTQAPLASLIIPIFEARVNGTILIGFSVQETGKLKSVAYSRPASTGVPAITKQVYNVNEWDKNYQILFLPVMMDSIEMPLDEKMVFTFEDMAGNKSEIKDWHFIIDAESDIPIVEIVLPFENEVITTDFAVSGVMFDDDEIKQIYWKLDNGPERIVTAKNGFFIPISLSDMTDNEHSVTVVAEDIYGVKSAPVTRGFRISLSEPSAAVTFPSFTDILRDVIKITGTSFDRNGIEKVEVSLDNGNTYNNAFGTNEWGYQFNTKILKDGAHVVFVRVTDKYGISATYSSLINVDNTQPVVTLDSPGDGSITTGLIGIMGRADDPNLEEVSIELRSLEGAIVSSELRSRKLDNNSIIKESLDLSSQQDGLYNIEIVATDKAKNVTRISRNVKLARASMKNFVEILYPLENENVQGVFNLYGYAGGTDKPETVTIRINGSDQITNEIEKSGYFRFSLEPEHFDNTSGEYKIIVYSNFGGNTPVMSREQNIVYKTDGPWVTIDSFNIGDFAYERPYFTGRSGYIRSEDNELMLNDKAVDKETKNAIKDMVPNITELSFDNGKTFIRTSASMKKGVQNYKYRLETGDMYEGVHYILVRSTMKNGETAVTRVLVQVDKTPPQIKLITPEPGGRYNTEIVYSASATDDVDLVELNYYLRKGDKSSYEIPGFLQGLYFEGIIPPFIKQIFNDAPNIFSGGATYFDVGMGLSFFGDNVKLQIQYGRMTQSLFESLGGQGQVRYGGDVLGLKLLANIYTLPFGSFAGPDWEWLFASFSVGANFSLFDIRQQGYTQSGKSTWMSALLIQLEFPKITIPKQRFLRTFSLFTEGQLWFVPTDVDADKMGIETIIPHIVIGLRVYIF